MITNIKENTNSMNDVFVSLLYLGTTQNVPSDHNFLIIIDPVIVQPVDVFKSLSYFNPDKEEGPDDIGIMLLHEVALSSAAPILAQLVKFYLCSG